MWIARDGNMKLYAYEDRPMKDSKIDENYSPTGEQIEIPKSWFKDLQFEDGPKKVKFRKSFNGFMSLK